MTTTFPARATIASPANPDNATAQGWFSALWDAITGILGTSGGLAEARCQLGVDTPQVISSVAGNALTVALKTALGNDASVAVPLPLVFRNATLSSGAKSVVNVSAALSLTVPSGTTLGTGSGADSWLYVYAMNAGGTVELAISASYFGNDFIGSSSAIAGGSSSTTIYSATARANVAMKLVTALRSQQTVAGTWASAITESRFPESGLPNAVVRSAVAGGTADALTATFVPAVPSLASIDTNGENAAPLLVRAASANVSTTPTLAVNGLTAKTIVKANGTALLPGDIAGAGHWLQLMYDLASDKFVLMNPAASGASLSGFRNKVRDGKMEITQRGTSFAGLTNSASYTLDGWIMAQSGSHVVTVSQQLDTMTGSECQYSLRVAVTTANAAPAAGNNAAIEQPIEGFLVRDLQGAPIGIQFEVRSAKTGTHCVAIRNTGGDRSYVMTYSVAAANTWQKVYLTLPAGLITAGTWDWTTGVGLRLDFVLMAGSTWQTTAGAWQTGNYLATAAQVNCMDTVGNVFAISAVQLEKTASGSAPPLEHRDAASERVFNSRYYQAIPGLIHSIALPGAMSLCFSVPYPVVMRAAPSVAFANVGYTSCSSLAVSGATNPTRLAIQFAVSSANTYAQVVYDALSSAEL